MTTEHKPQSVLDEAKAEIAFWDDLGAVEQMRQDASGWVGLVERLVEQLEAMREALRETIELIESEGFSFHYEERQEWIRLADSGAAGADTPSDSLSERSAGTRVSAPETSSPASRPCE